MGPRRKPAAPTYSQMFHYGVRTSSSGSSSSEAVPDSQTSKRVSWSPPPPAPHMPPPPPPQAAAPQPVLAGAVPPDLWHWSLGITERVKREFVAKAKTRLCNTVSDWKDKWEIYGYDGLEGNDSHHIRRNFGGSGIRETLQCSGFSGVRAGDAINPAVSRWITRQTDHRRDRQDLRRDESSDQKDRLDSLEDLLDVMVVGNPTMQRALNERRGALKMPIRNPEDSDPDRSQPSTATDYFDNM
uniref:Uncharacterized protein n=1 Tax=Brassica campestris TaxID=3711 RepID=M4F090_BRACM